MSLERFCHKAVVTVRAEQTIYDAALRMRDQHVGAVVVLEEDRPLGIVTDRDIVLRAMVERRDPEKTLVRDIMSRSLAFVRKDDKIDAAISAIREAGVRRVPILDVNDALVGMVTLDDLVVLIAGELAATASAIQANRGP